MKNLVRSILVVGGGSSGWMTAAAVCRQLPNVKVTLVESPNVPTIGVGESTIGHINEFMAFIRLKDEDWMAACNATYKTSIKFIDFRENPTETPHVFHYPFGIFDFTDKPHGLMEWFINRAINPEIDPYTFATFNHDSIIMTDAVKMTKNQDRRLRGFEFDQDTAYHMDATLFGNYLRDHVCKPAGLTHILADVTEVLADDNGVTGVVTNNGTLTADLYIDCTGFKSLLLEGAMNVPFVSFHDTLLNDRAIATVIPYIDIEREMECVTSCTAKEAGWVWNIPLWNRIGTGYVYSSKFATEEQASEQFRQHLKSNRMVCPDSDRAEQAEFRHIKIKHGVHKRAWEKNVVGIGLSNGFIEPLESTGLMLTHEGIIKMINTLKMRNGRVTQFDVDAFNFAFQDQIMGFKDFISQHYALSMRNDTPYWQHVSENTTYSPTMSDYNIAPTSYADLAFRHHRTRMYGNEMSGIVYIAAGMGYNPIDINRVLFMNKKYKEELSLATDAWDLWEKHRDQVISYVDQLPSHYQFLKDTIYNGNS